MSSAQTVSNSAQSQVSGFNHKKQVSTMMLGVQRLTNPVSLPDLPQPDGATKFFTGDKTSALHNRTLYHLIFFAEQDPQTVLKFYKDALVARQWSISKDSPDSLVAEHKNGHKCTIAVNEAEPPDGKSRLTITYWQFDRLQSSHFR